MKINQDTCKLQKTVCRACVNWLSPPWNEKDEGYWNEGTIYCPTSPVMPFKDALEHCPDIPAHQGCLWVREERKQ